MPLITVEGIDGVGKTTLVNNLKSIFKETCITTREPRYALVHKTKHSPISKLFLFMHDHANHVDCFIQPLLDDGALIISDRYIDSRIAYGIETLKNDIPNVREWLYNLHIWSVYPDMTILMVSSVDKCVARNCEDTPYSKDAPFLERVQNNYWDLVRDDKNNRFVIIDASKSMDEIVDIVATKIRRRFNV